MKEIDANVFGKSKVCNDFFFVSESITSFEKCTYKNKNPNDCCKGDK